jgi:voltage-gated potassium channel
MYYNYNPADKENRLSVAWLCFVCLISVWTAFEAPISFALGKLIHEHHLWWDGLFSSVFLADVYLRVANKLKLPEHQKNELHFTSKHQTVRAYHKTSWFIFDVAAALPLEIIAAVVGASIPLKVINLIRVIRVLRIIKLRSLIHLIDFIPKAFKILMIATAVMLAIHWFACGWMIINPRTEPDNLSFYIVSLYWAVTTLTTVGYGDITPTTNLSRIYTMGVMLVGVGVYGVIIAQFSRLMMLVDKYTEEKKEKMNGLSQYMKYYNIPSSLQRQVFSFYNHVLSKTVSDEDNQIINDLPQALQQELNIYTKIKLIKNVHIFKECSTPCLKMIAQKLEQTFHSPNEYIIRKGDAGEEMFIIGHGDVQVTHGEKILAELKSGQFFGEIALIEDTIRTADVQSKAYCDLYTFKKEDFLLITEKYPHLADKFHAIYSKRSSDTRDIDSNKNAA